MARNQEKAQSMLYRFREAQAATLGLSSSSSSSTLRRPRLASSVSSLKEAERWRSDVIREISRKVSKIQDVGLTDYEVRDLNDEINKLLREKAHWETQILQLGGANYRRSVPSMLGDEGVGKGGYKYFGRAKDLPGVKEAVTTQRREREERYERFNSLPPGYYGDEDEDDGVLLAEEASAEEGEWSRRFRQVAMGLHADLEEGSDADIQVPLIPRPPPKSWMETMQAFTHSLQSASAPPEQQHETAAKRPAPQDDPAHQGASAAKRQKAQAGHAVTPTTAHHTAYSIFTAQELQAPPVPDRTAMEKVILRERKRALREQYIGA